jgi:predicted metal-binding membrane protein
VSTGQDYADKRRDAMAEHKIGTTRFLEETMVLQRVVRESESRVRAPTPRSAARAFCVGSSIGLMLMFVALGVMSVTWMAVVTLVIVAQELAPPIPAVDVPLAIAIVGLGILIVVAPSPAPVLTPPV